MKRLKFFYFSLFATTQWKFSKEFFVTMFKSTNIFPRNFPLELIISTQVVPDIFSGIFSWVPRIYLRDFSRGFPNFLGYQRFIQGNYPRDFLQGFSLGIFHWHYHGFIGIYPRDFSRGLPKIYPGVSEIYPRDFLKGFSPGIFPRDVSIGF